LVYISNRYLADSLVWSLSRKEYITNVKITPDIDKNILTVEASVNEVSALDKIEVKVMDGSQVIASGRSINHLPVEITMPEQVKLWSPDSPFLYDLEITLWSDNKPQDKVNSYAAMRKYSIKRDNKGIVRLQLNNKDLFHFGPLDQGWWPDGLYTAPYRRCSEIRYSENQGSWV